MRIKHLNILLLVLLVYTCNSKKVDQLDAQTIIDRSIEVSGGEKFSRSNITFDFRDISYAAKRYKGKFSFARTIRTDSLPITDFLTNNGFKRMIGNKIITIADSMKTKYTASVNSVHYFSVLPFGLNDLAVNKTLLDEEQIKGKNYYKIKVTFDEEGGGEDFEDVFVYWIDKEIFTVDYLAYSYNEEDDIGMRFREAYNEQRINGLRFVDYNNYRVLHDTISLENLAHAFEKNQLQLLSKIELKNIQVQLIN